MSPAGGADLPRLPRAQSRQRPWGAQLPPGWPRRGARGPKGRPSGRSDQEILVITIPYHYYTLSALSTQKPRASCAQQKQIYLRIETAPKAGFRPHLSTIQCLSPRLPSGLGVRTLCRESLVDGFCLNPASQGFKAIPAQRAKEHALSWTRPRPLRKPMPPGYLWHLKSTKL